MNGAESLVRTLVAGGVNICFPTCHAQAAFTRSDESNASACLSAMPGEIIRVEPFVDCGMTARAIWPLPQLARSQRPGNAEPIFERQCRVCLDPRPGGLGDFDGLFKTTVCVNSRVRRTLRPQTRKRSR
jgi:hypothetical protein